MSAIAVLPQLDIDLAGESLDDSALSALESLRVHQVLSKPSLCELTFRSSASIAAFQDVAIGAALTVQAGGQRQTLFSGEITAIEYACDSLCTATVRLRAYDKLHRLRQQQTVRMHVQVTPVELARQLCTGIGATVESEAPGPVLQNVLQHDQSDLRVLDEVARRSGLFMTLRDDVLHLITLAGTGDAIPVAPGGALLDASVSVNADRACQSVSATGWSALRAALHQATAGQGATGQDADAVDMVADCPERMLTDEAADDDAQMEALAQSELDYRRARAVVFTGVAGGNPELRPGARVKLSGVSKQVAGQYVLASVTHSIDRSRGFVSELSSEPPPPPPRSRTAVASWGTVTRVDDPEAMGRVKVALPTMNSIESDWMFVVCPGGGTGKGLIVMPDVDDQVLVLFVDRDAAQGIVLGGLC
ncbi:MAG TPA: contractile injection system protein, VgrG/Pvc8 family, partial [Planctomycetaceae bacterium]|nr:contractile injection system protein, VgrG/Pvc8 family [Planctomycetaceae bacterium]